MYILYMYSNSEESLHCMCIMVQYSNYKRTNWNLVCRQTDDRLAPLVAGLMTVFLMLREESMSSEEALRLVVDPATPLPWNTLLMLEL